MITAPLIAVAAKRRNPGEVLGLGKMYDSGRGSTYWRRVMQCARETFFASEVHWLPEHNTDALDHGLVWHFVLETYYRALQEYQKTGVGTLVDCEQAGFRCLQAFVNEPGYEEIYDKTGVMLNSYFQRYAAKDAEQWEILAVEEGVVPPEYVKEHFGFEFSTRLDLIVNDYSLGEPVVRIIEHKSASRLDPLTVSGYTHDLQTLGQVWLADRFLDFDHHAPFMGSLVNVTTKQKIPLHERLPVQPSDAQLDCFEDTMRHWDSVLATYPATGFQKNYGVCTRRFGRCAYFEVCRSMPDTPVEVFRQWDESDQLPPGFIRKEVSQ